MPEKSVLVVEDDEIIARILLSMLREDDFNLLTPVNSGEQAIEQVVMERPDIVLMDIDLAGQISGIKAAAEIFNLFSIPVIFVTGHDERKILERAICSLPFGFLIKPVNPNLLISTIHVTLSLCEQMRQTTEGKKAGLTPFMDVQISGSVHPVILINSDLLIVWMNQSAEEYISERGESAILQDIHEKISANNPSIDIPSSFFRSMHDSVMPVSLSINGDMRQCIITARPIMNMFGVFSGSFITITMPS